MGRQDPYMLSHPLTRDRMRAMEGFVAAYGKAVPEDPTANYWFARVQGKLSGFLRDPNWTLRRAAESPSRDIALMREAVALSPAARHSDVRSRPSTAPWRCARAIPTSRPQGPRSCSRRAISARRYRLTPAAAAAPHEALILGGYGRALLGAGQYAEALTALETARGRDLQRCPHPA